MKFHIVHIFQWEKNQEKNLTVKYWGGVRHKYTFEYVKIRLACALSSSWSVLKDRIAGRLSMLPWLRLVLLSFSLIPFLSLKVTRPVPYSPILSGA